MSRLPEELEKLIEEKKVGKFVKQGGADRLSGKYADAMAKEIRCLRSLIRRVHSELRYGQGSREEREAMSSIENHGGLGIEDPYLE